MAQSRKRFTEELLRRGFKRYRPKNDIHRYIPREHYRLQQLAVAISEKGRAVDVTICEMDAKICRHFGSYRDGWDHLVLSLAHSHSTPQPKPKKRNEKGTRVSAF